MSVKAGVMACWFCREECVDGTTYDSYPVDEPPGPNGEMRGWFAHIKCIEAAHALVYPRKPSVKQLPKQEERR